jgi:hypothetical protein
LLYFHFLSFSSFSFFLSFSHWVHCFEFSSLLICFSLFGSFDFISHSHC